MQLRRVTTPDGPSVAIWHAERWVPLRAALDRYAAQGRILPPVVAAGVKNVVACLSGGEVFREQALTVLDAVRGVDFSDTFDPQPRLPFQPLSFRDFMLYEQHVIDASRGMVRRFMPQMAEALAAYEAQTGEPHPELRPKPLWYQKPIYYVGNHLSFIPDGATVPWPPYTQALDYELELGVVIAQPLRNATPEQAEAAIGGFVVVNDFSARDVQYPEMTSGFGPVKAKNFATSMSAVVVTPDEVWPHVDDLTAQVTVNGETWGMGHTAGRRYSLGEMVAYASLGESLRPGELLATGTIPGCSGMETGHWLSPGDEIVLSLDRVGTLRNTIGQPETPPA